MHNVIAYFIGGIAASFMPILKLAHPWSPRVDFKSSAAASLIFLEPLSFGLKRTKQNGRQTRHTGSGWSMLGGCYANQLGGD